MPDGGVAPVGVRVETFGSSRWRPTGAPSISPESSARRACRRSSGRCRRPSRTACPRVACSRRGPGARRRLPHDPGEGVAKAALHVALPASPGGGAGAARGARGRAAPTPDGASGRARRTVLSPRTSSRTSEKICSDVRLRLRLKIAPSGSASFARRCPSPRSRCAARCGSRRRRTAGGRCRRRRPAARPPWGWSRGSRRP